MRCLESPLSISGAILVLIELMFIESAGAVTLCPSPVPNGTFCINSTNTPFIVPPGWKAASKIVMESGTAMRFDPSTQSFWRLDLGTLITGEDVIFDLSGHDVQGQAARGPNGKDGPRMGNGGAGHGGATGSKGGDTAGLELHVQNVQIGGLTILRKGGKGQRGGDGGFGGRGGGATCEHNAGDGGRGGPGGEGGPGGTAKAVKIYYGKLKLRPDIVKSLDKAKATSDYVALQKITSSIGIIDQAVKGQGGEPGVSGHGGTQEGGTCGCGVWPVQWCTGGGIERSNEYPQNLGKGVDGKIEEFSVRPETNKDLVDPNPDEGGVSIDATVIRRPSNNEE